MAFTGTAVTKKVSDGLYRVTGLSLGIGAAGTIGLDGGTGEVDLKTPNWNAQGSVTLSDAIQVTAGLAGAGAVAPAVAVTKAGTSVADFLATLTNNGAAATGPLEIYVRYFL